MKWCESHVVCFQQRFAVTPLTEECGILEWVPNVAPLRNAVEGMYRQDKLFDNTTNSTIKRIWEAYPHKVPCLLVHPCPLSSPSEKDAHGSLVPPVLPL